MVKVLLVKLLTKLLASLIETPVLYAQTVEQEMGVLSQMWEYPATHRYFDKRERYLVDMTANEVASGHMPDAKFFAGRLHEMREFKSQLSAASAYTQRKKKERALAAAKQDA